MEATGTVVTMRCAARFRSVVLTSLKPGDKVYYVIGPRRLDVDSFAHGPVELVDAATSSVKTSAGHVIKMSRMQRWFVRED